MSGIFTVAQFNQLSADELGEKPTRAHTHTQKKTHKTKPEKPVSVKLLFSHISFLMQENKK